MPVTGYHSEWVTIDESRVFLQCRGGFPSKRMHLIAQVVVESLKWRSEDARLVKIFYDDKFSSHHIILASDKQDDSKLGDNIEEIVNNIFGYGNDTAEIIIVEPGNKLSDHYEHMEHLSVGAEVAVDRFKHSDAEYMKDVEVPS